MKIKLITIIGLSMILLIPSIFGFERITSSEDALSKELGVIHLIGERHGLRQDREQNKLLEDLAYEGNIILGIEGMYETGGRELNSTVFGIEEPLLHQVSEIFLNVIRIVSHAGYKKYVKLPDSSSDGHEYGDILPEPARMMRQSLRIIWDYLKMAILTNEDPKEISFFQTQVSQVLMNFLRAMEEDEEGTLNGTGSIYKHLGTNSIDDNFYDNLSNDSREWFILLHQAAQYFIAQSVLPEKTSETLNALLLQLNRLYEEIEICTDSLRMKQIHERLEAINDNGVQPLIMKSRNVVFLRNILRAYNEKKHLGKPFFVTVGANHVAFLKRNLMAAGFAVAVNDGVYNYASGEFAEKIEL